MCVLFASRMNRFLRSTATTNVVQDRLVSVFRTNTITIFGMLYIYICMLSVAP